MISIVEASMTRLQPIWMAQKNDKRSAPWKAFCKRRVQTILWGVVGLSLVLGLSMPWRPAVGQSPAINIARPTWDTGWFQAEVYRELLQELGYQVNEPRTLDNEDFYTQAAEGKFDLWASGWFPLHERYLNQPDIAGKMEPVGFEVPAGAVQGYMIDKTTAERLNIRNLGDLSKPNIAAEFDWNGNGQADLIGCNTEWACAEVINHHLEVYNLNNTVEHVQGVYAPLIEEAIARYRRGEPILFYTWTPNWAMSELVPGKDVVWLEVPYPALPAGQDNLESETILTGIEGCVADPCTIGFPRNDIRAVANTEFLDNNPAVRALLEQVAIPLNDIANQNARMVAGESAEADIRRHAQEWVAANRSTISNWISTAQATAQIPPTKVDSPEVEPQNQVLSPAPPLRVVTKRFEPFVIYKDHQYQGFSIDLWNTIATELNLSYELVGVNSVAKLLDEVERGAADVAVAGIGITSQGEETLDFSYPYYESGLQVMVHSNSSELGQLLSTVVTVLSSPRLYYGLGIFVLSLLVVAHLLWFSERSHNSQFPTNYLQGIWEAFWWAAVTVTTVGYGDKVPKKPIGRFFGLVWMFVGYFIFAYFTASIATTFTVQELQGTINGPEDLPGKRIATVTNSAAAEYLDSQTNLLFRTYNTQEETIKELIQSNVDAIVYDAPVLQYLAAHQSQGQYKVVGDVFQPLNYGIALQQGSPYREPFNAALLKLYETGEYDDIYQKWFGLSEAR